MNARSLSRLSKGLSLSLGLAASGCALLNPPMAGMDPSYAPTMPVSPNPRLARFHDGGIYSAETSLPLFETPRARHPGDLITVVLLEKTDAKKKATTRSRKDDTIQLANNAFLGRPISFGSGYNLNFDIENARQFNGDTQSVQNNMLEGNISVTVSEVLANGNMLIQGEKWVQINQGKEFIRLAGIIRPQDIRPDNSITSDKVGNARIYYGGVGQANNTNAQGWFSRFLWSPLYPT